jgi:catechol 2,3-dioxygenase-like lactoylglutathione lyase family enzyme
MGDNPEFSGLAAVGPGLSAARRSVAPDPERQTDHRPGRDVMSRIRTVCFLLATFFAVCAAPSARAMELVGIDHFAINVLDLQRSADWYQKVLGFTILHKWSTTWMVGRDNIKIGLFLRPNAKPLPDIDSQLIIQHVAFLVDGDKFASAQAELAKAGVKIDGPEDTGIAYSIFFNDPDGHLLEITTYHPVPPGAIKATGSQPAHTP